MALECWKEKLTVKHFKTPSGNTFVCYIKSLRFLMVVGFCYCTKEIKMGGAYSYGRDVKYTQIFFVGNPRGRKRPLGEIQTLIGG